MKARVRAKGIRDTARSHICTAVYMSNTHVAYHNPPQIYSHGTIHITLLLVPHMSFVSNLHEVRLVHDTTV